MTYQELKMIMRAKASLTKGLVNLLKDDAEQIYIYVDDFDMFNLGESLRDAKLTVQQLIDTIAELERDLRTAKRDI